ncbi:MAG TPA: hypothetical protein DGG94_07125 [Micromonosporaceae bacterium]|nr:hypothetical protein [Micromonosporaceae bacterium]HCU49558.1 hypothetical protein [Micromonosporaceae bacterium]
MGSLRRNRPRRPARSNGSECGTTFKGECATIEVPVDWTRPTWKTFQLAIGRLKALEPTKRIGVLVAHPGGPGVSGIDTYIVGRRIPDDSPLRKYFDIVSVDPRGVARSNAVTCSGDLVSQTPTTFPATETEYLNLLNFNDKLAQDCRAHTGPLFDYIDTASASRDVDAIRAALGLQRISFFGASYGTQVGQQYAELFPHRIRAIALHSNMDHSMTSAFQYLKTTTEDQEASYLEFAGWCDRTSACALHGRNPVAVWDKLHALAEAGNLVDPQDGTKLSSEALRTEMFVQSYRPKTHWFPLASRLAALADHNEQRATIAQPRSAANAVENPYPAIWCSDWRWDIDSFAELDLYRRYLANRVAPHTKLSPFWSDVTMCLGWSGPFNNPQHRLAIRNTPTILITKSRHDVGTPKAWTYAVAQQIPNSVLLEYDGVGHGVFRISTCGRQLIEMYLTYLVTPPRGTHCAAEYPSQPDAAAQANGWIDPPGHRN